MLRGILQCLEATKVDRCLDGRVETGARESRIDFEANVGTGFGQLRSEGGRQTAVRENGWKNTPGQVAQRLQRVLGLRADLLQERAGAHRSRFQHLMREASSDGDGHKMLLGTVVDVPF